jgi:nudix-type nucleoside diphosphatase (YffH/AdpP family)
VVSSIFFYGSLRDHRLLETVLGRAVDPDHLEPAWVAGYVVRRVANEVYPVLLPASECRADGAIFHQATAADLECLAFFEEAEYQLVPITVEAAGGRCAAQYFRGTDKPTASADDWDLATWRREHRAAAIETTREYMHHHRILPVEQIDTIWPGVKIRGLQRARAQAATPHLGAIRTGFGPGDVERHALNRAYTSFLAVQEMRLRHRRFDGGWTADMDRSVVAWGDAVTILPYDPRRDRVLLIEQFRPGPAARGDANPWCIEVVAGRIDRNESAEQTARREAGEEAGLEIGRTLEIGGYYPTPGLACEHLTGFIGEADLGGEGGIHGLVDEGEDIRSIVLDFAAAMEAVEAGAVNSGPALVSLLWLSAQRARVRREWAGIGVETGGPSD